VFAVTGQRELAVSRVDIKSGTRQPLFTVERPADAGTPFQLRISDDGRTYVYSYAQVSSELFLMRNVR
jgi:hypothetical protein